MKQHHYPELDETLYMDRLPNGLTVAVVPRKGFSRKLCYFVTDFGSIHTSFHLEGRDYQAPAGVAHFLEHKLFDLPGDRDVSAEFAQLGASVNAFTSYDMTAYYFSCTDHFEPCLRLLLEFVSTPYFTEESVQKEQGIIDQEIGMNQDSPDSMVFENLVGALYETHNVRVPILGTSQTIREITPEVLYTCHRAFYTPGNMMLCVVGDADPQAVAQTALEILGKEQRPVGQKQQPLPEPLQARLPQVTARSEVAMPMFSLGFKAEPLDSGEAAIRREMVADLAAEALFGESSRLYLRLYEEGIIDSSFGGGFETIDGCAMLLCSGDSDHPQKVRDALLARAGEIVREWLSQEDFLRMKRSALGRRIRSLDSFNATCFRLCAYHFSKFDYFRFPEVYRSIQPEEICAFLAQTVLPQACCLSVIYPTEKEESL